MGCSLSSRGRSVSSRPPNEHATLWRYDPINEQSVAIRATPEFDAVSSAGGAQLDPGDIFWVDEELVVDDVTFLRLADGSGWVFDRKPKVGVMCVRHKSARECLHEALGRTEARVGTAAVHGRYHRLPQRLEDDYNLRGSKILGTGCNGNVFLASSRHTGAKVAVKHLDLTNISQQDMLALVAEVEILLSLDHPHVARLFDVYETEDRLSLVMEHCAGGELFDRLTDREYFDEKDAAEAVRQMLVAVQYIHSRGISHRDLKLENFLYESGDSPFLKLIDFGLSQHISKDENGGMMTDCVGTTSYIAPEVLSKQYDSQCDVWSLGVVTYVLLSGQMPFSQESEKQKLRDIKKANYSLTVGRWPEISAAAVDFVRSLLELRPEKRLTIAQALRHPWLSEQGATSAPAVRAVASRSRRRVSDETVLAGAVRAQAASAVRRFARSTPLRQEVLRLAARTVPQATLGGVRQLFLQLDAAGTGAVGVKSLHDEWREKMPEDLRHGLKKAFPRSLSSDGDFMLCYSDFLAAFMSEEDLGAKLAKDAIRRLAPGGRDRVTAATAQRVLGESREMEKAFCQIDQEGRGYITTRELVALHRVGGEETGTPKAVETTSSKASRAGADAWAQPNPQFLSDENFAADDDTEQLKKDGPFGSAEVCAIATKRSRGCYLVDRRSRILLSLPFLFTLVATSNPILLQ